MKMIKAMQKGFTLIEVMIVVAIIGLIASIALPSYDGYVDRGRAAEAMANLADMRIRMEQCFQDWRDYTNDACAAICTGTTGQNFTYSCVAANTSATTYRLSAAGSGDMTGFDFTVDENNARTSTYDGTTGTDCWLTSKQGSC
ncbi:MAG: type IV pilus assembly protein PilE [Methylophilaceae bacterium]|jgi:type IV pilus assembly protein PilE